MAAGARQGEERAKSVEQDRAGAPALVSRRPLAVARSRLYDQKMDDEAAPRPVLVFLVRALVAFVAACAVGLVLYWADADLFAVYAYGAFGFFTFVQVLVSIPAALLARPARVKALVVVSPVLVFVPIAIVVGLVAGRGGAGASPFLGGAAVLAAVAVAQLCAAVAAWLLREAFRAWRVRSALAEGEF